MTDSPDQIQLTIDGQLITVPKGTSVYSAAKMAGIELPIFCYHDRMPPFGACRVCLVQVEKMGKLQTSCTLAATDGMVVSTQSQLAQQGRKEILEFLLINHPLDCPICDKGGECPLQDQVVKFGPGESRFYDEKRDFEKAVSLSPVLKLDKERCISCARCTRFGETVAGDCALQFIDRGYKTEVGTADGEAADSKFIGNTIMICPVGALTSDVYRFQARPWDSASTKTVCTLCPIGCGMTLDARDGKIVRTRSAETPEINDIWLCDKGWFGYEFIESRERLAQPMIRHRGELTRVSWSDAIGFAAEKLRGAESIAALGGLPLTVEENFLFQQLICDRLFSPNIDHRAPMPVMDSPEIASGMEISINEIDSLTHVILFGLDITEELPILWLRLKKAIDRGARALFFGHFKPEIGRYMESITLHAPGEEEATLKRESTAISEFLQKADRAAIFIGRQYLSSIDRNAIMSRIASIAEHLPSLSINIMDGKQNSMGARFAGVHPFFGPGGILRESPGKNSYEILQRAASDGWDILYTAGANIAARSSKDRWRQIRKKTSCIIAQDLFLTETARDADIVLPTLSCFEKAGRWINLEGRIQELRPGKEIPSHLLSDGDIFTEIGRAIGAPLGIDPQFQALLNNSTLIRKSRLSPLRQPMHMMPSAPRVETRTLSASFAPMLFDEGVSVRQSEHISRLAKLPRIRIHPSDAKTRGLQNNDKIFLFSRNCAIENRIAAEVAVDENVAPRCAVIPIGFQGISACELDPYLLNGVSVEIIKAISE